MAETLLTRGRIAAELHINPETLRYYESQKLIKKPKRLSNQYRVYDEDDKQWLQFILMAKSLGFSLKEIKILMNLSLTENSDREQVRAIAQQKTDMIQDKIKQLTALKNLLDELITLCLHDKTTAECPILASLHCKK